MIQRHPKTNYPRRNITLWQLSTSPHQRLRSPACSGSTMKPEWWTWPARDRGSFFASFWSSACTTSSCGCTNSFWSHSSHQFSLLWETVAVRRRFRRILRPGKPAFKSVRSTMSSPRMLWTRIPSIMLLLWPLHMEMIKRRSKHCCKHVTQLCWDSSTSCHFARWNFFACTLRILLGPGPEGCRTGLGRGTCTTSYHVVLKQASNKSWAVEAVLLKTGTGNKSKSSNISKCFGSFGKKRVHWLLLFCFQMLWKVATVNSLNSNTLTKPFCLLTQGCLWDRCGLRLLKPLVIVQPGWETKRKLGILRTRRGKKNLGSLISRKTTWWFMISEHIRTISASKNKGNTWKYHLNMPAAATLHVRSFVCALPRRVDWNVCLAMLCDCFWLIK